MDKAVKVRTTAQKLDPFLQKTFKIHPSYLLHDPNNSVRTGDVVRFQRFPVPTPSKRIRHMVTEIVTAYGPRLDERLPLLSEEEREERLKEVVERRERRAKQKTERRETKMKEKEERRREAWREVRRRGKVRKDEEGGEAVAVEAEGQVNVEIKVAR